jgi:hypothetical protein
MPKFFEKIISTCKSAAKPTVETVNAIHLSTLFFGLGNVCKPILASPASFAAFSAEECAKTIFCAHQAYKDYKDGKGYKSWLPQICLAIADATAGTAAGFVASGSAALEAYVAPEFAAALSIITLVHGAKLITAAADVNFSSSKVWRHFANTVLTGIAVAAVVDALIAKDKEHGAGMLLIGALAATGLAIDTIRSHISLFFCKGADKQPEETDPLIVTEEQHQPHVSRQSELTYTTMSYQML